MERDNKENTDEWNVRQEVSGRKERVTIQILYYIILLLFLDTANIIKYHHFIHSLFADFTLLLLETDEKSESLYLVCQSLIVKYNNSCS